MVIRLSENFRAVFYAPFYATIALGHYRDAGLDVRLLASPAPGTAAGGLLDGTIDVTWGGPMRVMKARNEPGGPPLVCFCEVVRKDPFYLVGRRGLGGFELRDLARLKFASVSEVPTPWLCLQHDLREAGIDPGGLDRISRSDHGAEPRGARARARSTSRRCSSPTRRWRCGRGSARSCTPRARAG